MPQRCAACAAELPDTARFCDACGAAVYPLSSAAPVPPALPLPASDARAGGAEPRRAAPAVWWTLAAVLALGVGAAAWTVAAPPAVTASALTDALRIASAQGDAPGQDPVCVANGLVYDAQPVNVQIGNATTLAWMDALVGAGLYAPAEDGQSGGFLSQPIRIYAPRSELAAWAGARRLCMARGVTPLAVGNIGAVHGRRLRGESYPGVSADVVWELEGAAPWLAVPDVASAFINELPSWRGARWQVTPQGWRLTQRKDFYFDGRRWLTSESLERSAAAPVERPPPAP